MKHFQTFKQTALAIVVTVALGGCTEKEVASDKAEPKPDVNIVTLTKANLEHVTIKTEGAALGTMETTLKTAGSVTANANKTAKVVSTLEGRLVRLNFDLNDAVKTGDVLALVQTPELLGKSLEIKASIDGVIIDRKASTGELVGKDKEIYTISDPTDLWVIAEIKERDVGAVKVGQDTAFSVLPYPGETFRGKVVRLGNQVQPESRTLEVRIEVNNADGRLKPGMFADLEITTSVTPDVIVVPETALQIIDETPVIFIALGGNRFEKRVVKTGVPQHGHVQMLDGIKLGEQIVTDGGFTLKSEMLKGELQDND